MLICIIDRGCSLVLCVFFRGSLVPKDFPECVAKGSRFTFWGSGGGGVFAGRRLVFAAVCNRPQPSATVCERPFWQKVAVPMEKLQKASFLECDVASFRVAGVALCGMWLRDRGGRKLPCLWEKLQRERK